MNLFLYMVLMPLIQRNMVLLGDINVGVVFVFLHLGLFMLV